MGNARAIFLILGIFVIVVVEWLLTPGLRQIMNAVLSLVASVSMVVAMLPRIRQSRRGTNQSFGGVAVMGLADQIKKLDDLRQTGVLTDQEFQAAKVRLLQLPQVLQ